MAESRTRTGTLRHGLRIGDEVHKEFVLREGTAQDYFDAEAEADSLGRPVAYKAALTARQLVSIGSYTGPFSVAMLGRLKVSDLYTLEAARDALEIEGEAEQHG